MPEAPLAGQVALVTGASTGIGLALARGLAERGAVVAGLARGAERLSAAMADISAASGARTVAVAADVADLAAVRTAVARVEAELGPVDLLVNNAGLIDAAEVPVWEADPEQWWSVVESHVRGGFHLVRAVVPGMVARGSGRVVDLGSGAGLRAKGDYSAYSVAKSGLMRITEALAESLAGTGVHAFDVAPGVVDTGMTRSMAMWAGRTDWTDPRVVVAMVTDIAAGRLDQWSGRFLHAARDTADVLAGVTDLDDDARRLRLAPWGADDDFRR